ncbi:PREDICTED: putative lipid-binding protein AIR1 [Camelina sativa]|uniref:Lipid-binding protein AIR1 n=1 Tax=Camelina sativa TaxID=90675 RepID=A0ABM0U0F8_CAMSA|nr:PREDICTED: putative lipid-binding protein AIR1 [Camelina sativa]
MASKNMMKNTIALFLIINLVFLGFTMSQAPPPQAPVCPRDSIQLLACINVIRLSLILNNRTARPCCTLVAGLDVSAASVCICNSIRITALNFLRINLRVNEVLRLCNLPPPAGFRCT